MTTIKKTLFFGTYQKDKNYHSHKIYITNNSVIICGVDENDPNSDFIEISFEDWEDMQQFIYEEKRDNKI
jgi:hypothetical protein